MACSETMTETVEGNNGGDGNAVVDFLVDEKYEFSAPRFFNFVNEESQEELQRAESWFENGKSHAPSPFMMRIKGSRFAKEDDIFCDFSNGEKSTSRVDLGTYEGSDKHDPTNINKEIINQTASEAENFEQEMGADCSSTEPPSKLKSSEHKSISIDKCISSSKQNSCHIETYALPASTRAPTLLGSVACTPKVPSRSSVRVAPESVTNQTEKKNITKSSFTPKPRKNLPPPQSSRSVKPKISSRRPGNGFAAKGTTAFDNSQENQAIKRQKLDGDGRTRQIHCVKTRVLHHKSKPNSTSIMETVSLVTEKHQEAVPFVSVAELIKKFESKTREMELPQNQSLSHEDAIQIKQMRPKLTLTRPKEPDFETTHRVRAVRIKSSAELEEEMLAKIPKFKARPVNKKILEAPAQPTPARSVPQAPQFQEFHLKTMQRAIQHAKAVSVTSSVDSSCQEFHLKTMQRANQHAKAVSVTSSVDSSCQSHAKIPKLTEPKPPLLFTSLRSRPPRVKSSQELELEELAKVPKFKARPLNKRIFESKGDASLFSNPKRQLTIPQEFHFATNDRLGPLPSTTKVEDLFDKLSIHSERSEHVIPRLTMPNPFNLHTEERGLEKERRFEEQLRRQQIHEEKLRVPKANPYPYTTDYPVIPSKPEPKSCTKPEGFMLESLIRHEDVLQKKMEEKERLEREEAERRIFRAQPIMKEDPIPLPEKERKPLTEVQELVLHVDHRAEDRAEFDKKIKEKEMMYKRQREENEHAQRIEEEKDLKKMRKKMVPHARPLPSFAIPFVPQKAVREMTRPKSPKLLVAEREKRRRYLR